LISATASSTGNKSGCYDGEAVELLVSVFSKLEDIASSSWGQKQALIILSDETAQVLNWQHLTAMVVSTVRG